MPAAICSCPSRAGSAGVQRVDLRDSNYDTRTVTIVAPGTQGFASGDASRWTPWGSYLTAEESWGTGSSKGRLFEVTNATTAGANGGNLVQRSIIPRVSHEGLAFDKDNNLYFIDELNGGSLYKYVSAKPGAATGADFFAKGQTFVLKVGAGGQSEGNNGPAITGSASWVAITDANGGGAGRHLHRACRRYHRRPRDRRPCRMSWAPATIAQRIWRFRRHPAAGRFSTSPPPTPTATATAPMGAVGSIRSIWPRTTSGWLPIAALRDMATGLAVGATWSNPDNLAIDANGNIYGIEDQDGGRADIWFLQDIDRDGVAEAVGKWASLSTPGAEPTGLYFDPFNPDVAYVNVQHPTSGNDLLVQITAVPEPETCSMVLAGLGLLGATARRRRRA
jgi:MYXO-CTERM domain-containing protein